MILSLSYHEVYNFLPLPISLPPLMPLTTLFSALQPHWPPYTFSNLQCSSSPTYYLKMGPLQGMRVERERDLETCNIYLQHALLLQIPLCFQPVLTGFSVIHNAKSPN